MKKHRAFGIRMFVVVSLMLILASCARSPIKNASEAMRPIDEVPHLQDDLGLADLSKALAANIKRLKEHQSMPEPLSFGPRKIAKQDYIASLKYLKKVLDTDPTGTAFFEELKTKFQFFEIYGKNDWGEVFLTSYYDPIIRGSRKKTKKYSQALYYTPKDLVTLKMGRFSERFPRLSNLGGMLTEQKSPLGTLRGRLVWPEKGSNELPYVIPFYDREEIDEHGLIKSKRAVIAWVDPIDAFFLHIQGSGTVRFRNGREVNVGYASQNGHPYVPIGKFLLDVIPIEKMSLQTIEQHLRSITREEAQAILNKNPSYVFFRKLKTKSIGYFGAEVVPGRTIATDTKYFPKGALGFLEFEKPVFESKQAIEPKEWIKASRLVLDQDTGGAIRGPHRLDLYWGKGDIAEQSAGVMKRWGRLYYIVPKQEFISAFQ